MSSLLHGPIPPDPSEAFQRTGLWRAEAPLPGSRVGIAALIEDYEFLRAGSRISEHATMYRPAMMTGGIASYP